MCGQGCQLCIEIGPGPGGLTAALLERTQRLVAIEVDPVLAQGLRAKYLGDSRFSLVEDDVLSTELTQWGRARVCGNLPYYITSPIIHKALEMGDLLEIGVFLMQREVAHRIAAGPGSRDYGFLSVAVQARAEVELLFGVKPSSFKPPPKVESAVVRLTPRRHPAVRNVAAFLRFAGQCFRQKRKTLRNNLRGAYLLEGDPAFEKRAEQLSIGELAGLLERVAPSGPLY